MLDIELQVRCGDYYSNLLKTDTGVPQGDGLSANEFTFYLAKALSSSPHQDHPYCNSQPQAPKYISTEHCYAKPINKMIYINQEYADDISFISSNPNLINYNKISYQQNLKIEILPSMNQKANTMRSQEKEMKTGKNVNILDRFSIQKKI